MYKTITDCPDEVEGLDITSAMNLGSQAADIVSEYQQQRP